MRYDRYRRALAHIWLKNERGDLENLAIKLASAGYTMSFYVTGMNTKIDATMRVAMQHKVGMFNLPEEVFMHPFRPWDLRKRWTDLSSCPTEYKAYTHITNAPEQPGSMWKEGASVDEERRGTDETATYHFRIVESSLRYESLCYKATSTIAGAGFGLFLRPHDTITQGSHLCLYASRQATAEELQASSRDYALKAANGYWFDAQVEDGNNLGRFVNMPGVKEALLKLVDLSRKNTHPQFFERQWKELEDNIVEECDATYKVEKGQLVVVARRDISASRRAHEIFASYGSLREYWLRGINESPENYPKFMVDIVQWLLRSPECNWTEAQRKNWVS